MAENKVPKNLRKGAKIVFEATGEHRPPRVDEWAYASNGSIWRSVISGGDPRPILSDPIFVDPEPEPTYREMTEAFLNKGDPSQAFIDWTRDLSDRLDGLVRWMEDER